MDIRLRGISGIEATQLIKQNCPEVKIIGLSFHIESDYAEKIMQSGAMGISVKKFLPDEIFKAITEVYSRKNVYLPGDCRSAFLIFFHFFYATAYLAGLIGRPEIRA